MATLYKRATPSQAMILRIVEGAVKNACDSHNVEFDPKHARSIAKRAAGTLSAEMSAVLGAKPSARVGVATTRFNGSQPARSPQLARMAGAPSLPGARDPGGSSIKPPDLCSLKKLEKLNKWITMQMWRIKKSGNDERAKAFIDVLRKIDQLKA